VDIEVGVVHRSYFTEISAYLLELNGWRRLIGHVGFDSLAREKRTSGGTENHCPPEVE
jgi:hypothetical protein